MIEPKNVAKINIFPCDNKHNGNWQMNTMYDGSSGWHIVYGSTIEDCFNKEFNTETEEDPFS